ncbi:hypothetical protein TraAM80_01831 [Trypanosoma rangeli]|uniref:Uncharacterized protein n=1 Tax=Trypanosoma rangeli TaxID=5698 RepID=A0A3R7MYP0_TRYRA|nr:uncharacterized protein TraAM80_01831 [Trypanosoma rangeli]RNF10082.1 hypothetical protein TraAM80_01831 [Trypanosoma rangeli]|eukprot:RNF10082.1 hypothetical protein TraAM80_01831 [Trypanosoma rangeli]
MRRLVRVAAVPSSLAVIVRRRSSSAWIARLLYGARASPLLGSWDVCSSSKQQKLDDTARELYCKALTHASGGGRLARDWIAGCVAIVCPSDTLLNIALKHPGTEQDVERYRTYLLSTLRKRMQEGPNEGAGVGGGGAASSSSREAVVKRLGSMPEVRCFVYDATRAACFHRYNKVPEEDRQQLDAVAHRLGVDEEVTRGIWRLVESEGAVEREKQRALDHPWSD